MFALCTHRGPCDGTLITDVCICGVGDCGVGVGCERTDCVRVCGGCVRVDEGSVGCVMAEGGWVGCVKIGP